MREDELDTELNDISLEFNNRIQLIVAIRNYILTNFVPKSDVRESYYSVEDILNAKKNDLGLFVDNYGNNQNVEKSEVEEKGPTILGGVNGQYDQPEDEVEEKGIGKTPITLSITKCSNCLHERQDHVYNTEKNHDYCARQDCECENYYQDNIKPPASGKIEKLDIMPRNNIININTHYSVDTISELLGYLVETERKLNEVIEVINHLLDVDKEMGGVEPGSLYGPSLRELLTKGKDLSASDKTRLWARQQG